VDIEASIEAVRHLAPHAAIAREAARLRRDELDGSLAIAQTDLDRAQVDTLIDRGIATGDHRLEHYIAARDLATASLWVAEQRAIAVADPRPLITVEDVRRLHTLATAGRPEMRPGVWRLAVASPLSGVVFPPPWQIAKETTALVERFRRRPATRDVPAWIAAFLARYARVRPFAAANGTAGRLAAALLLRRLDIVPLAVPRERADAYRAALAAAEIGAATSLQQIVNDALLNGSRRLLAASGSEPLAPLRELAGTRYTALIKASKRGRLASVTRDGRVYSTNAWIREYFSSRHL
jgi:Fic family protein